MAVVEGRMLGTAAWSLLLSDEIPRGEAVGIWVDGCHQQTDSTLKEPSFSRHVLPMKAGVSPRVEDIKQSDIENFVLSRLVNFIFNLVLRSY